jgi:hypothetical protein
MCIFNDPCLFCQNIIPYVIKQLFSAQATSSPTFEPEVQLLWS